MSVAENGLISVESTARKTAFREIKLLSIIIDAISIHMKICLFRAAIWQLGEP